jgi:hypothetical protein
MPSDLTDRIRMILENRAILRAYMQQALDNMVYYRGDIKLSVQIGMPVLFSYDFLRYLQQGDVDLLSAILQGKSSSNCYDPYCR